MRVLFVAAEAVPLAKVGGLADVAGSLPGALRQRGHDVRLVLPRYPQIDVTGARVPIDQLWLQWGDGEIGVRILEVRLPDGTPTWLVEHFDLFWRDRVYGYDDDLERFLLLSRAALTAAEWLDFVPDVVHGHDWHTGLITRYVRDRRAANGAWAGTAGVLTLHNLAFQGWLPAAAATEAQVAVPTGTPGLNILETAIRAADRVNTVSPSYAREVVATDLGFGLQTVLGGLGDHFAGILNGIDDVTWDPASDPQLPMTYRADDLAGKAVCRAGLRRELGLDALAPGPLLGIVSRLTEQKGLDLLLAAIPAILELPWQLAVLGTGEARYETALAALAEAHPGRIALSNVYDEAASHRMYAGLDAFLMPSRFEPCGIGQQLAMRYGTVPIVRRTGGLADTVDDGVTGLVFGEYSAAGLETALRRAIDAFDRPAVWHGLLTEGMRRDFGWGRSAAAYEALYEAARSGLV